MACGDEIQLARIPKIFHRDRVIQTMYTLVQYSHHASFKHPTTTDLTFHRAYTKTASSADAHAKNAKQAAFDGARIVATSTASSTMYRPQTRRSLSPISKINQDLC